MKQTDERLLELGLQAMQADEPEDAQIAASARSIAKRLGIDDFHAFSETAAAPAIHNCEDVQRLLPAHRAGTLSSASAMLIQAHLGECGACLRQYRSASGSAVLDWSAPAFASTKSRKASVWTPKKLAWSFGSVLVPAAAVLACAVFAYKAYWQVPPGVRAEVTSIDGSAYRISENGDRQLAPGDKLAEGERLRTSGGAHAVLRLSDGSSVEMNERSVLEVGARGHNMTVSLDDGAVIVQAAKRASGHLYVKTPDCRVAVTGTVFSVDSGIKGSRVAVLEGDVQVMHGGVDTTVHAGDQISTNDNLTPAPVGDQIAWSHDRDKYLPLLAQFAALRNKLEAIPFPQSRYSSDLLARMPSDTLLYISIPNLGDFLSQANKIFHDQLQQSPALQQWWGQDKGRNTAELDLLVDKLHTMSQYLGDEVVVVGVQQADKTVGNPSFAIVADVRKSGFADFLKTQLPLFASGSAPAKQIPAVQIFDEASLAAAPSASASNQGIFALVRQHEVVFSNSVANLKQMNAQLSATASGFANGDFGKQIDAAYSRGAGVILAADLHTMVGSRISLVRADRQKSGALEESGMEDVRYLIAEHREINGVPDNHLNLQFSGARQRLASWLAAPAPIGSLDFITPNAAIAVAFLTKDPKAIADDILSIADSDKQAQMKNLNDAEAKLHIDIRNDLAANLGGDFLVSLDGPVLPTPAWKAVLEVHNSDRLEKTLERLVQSIGQQSQGGAQGIAIDASEVGGQRYYALRNLKSGATVAHYTFADGYMILAANRALVMEALQTHASGNSLARSAAFKALLPRDANENYSAVAYQNLSPVLAPLLSQLSGESAQAIRQLAADSRPTAICAWGRDSRIEAASDSRLFGFDFLTLGSLMKAAPGVQAIPGNNYGNRNVRD